jgi:hypothetical protein
MRRPALSGLAPDGGFPLLSGHIVLLYDSLHAKRCAHHHRFRRRAALSGCIQTAVTAAA